MSSVKDLAQLETTAQKVIEKTIGYTMTQGAVFSEEMQARLLAYEPLKEVVKTILSEADKITAENIDKYDQQLRTSFSKLKGMNTLQLARDSTNLSKNQIAALETQTILMLCPLLLLAHSQQVPIEIILERCTNPQFKNTCIFPVQYPAGTHAIAQSINESLIASDAFALENSDKLQCIIQFLQGSVINHEELLRLADKHPSKVSTIFSSEALDAIAEKMKDIKNSIPLDEIVEKLPLEIRGTIRLKILEEAMKETVNGFIFDAIQQLKVVDEAKLESQSTHLIEAEVINEEGFLDLF